jgi:hypothetical protein
MIWNDMAEKEYFSERQTHSQPDPEKYSYFCYQFKLMNSPLPVSITFKKNSLI